MSRGSLDKHLKLLRQEDLIYKGIVEPTQTLDSSRVGSVVYKVKEDEMKEYLHRTMHMNISFLDLIEDQELRAKLNRYARDMAHAIAEYLNKLQATRQRRLESELQRVGKKKLT